VTKLLAPETTHSWWGSEMVNTIPSTPDSSLVSGIIPPHPKNLSPPLLLMESEGFITVDTTAFVHSSLLIHNCYGIGG
jgi:hypothetical protein